MPNCVVSAGVLVTVRVSPAPSNLRPSARPHAMFVSTADTPRPCSIPLPVPSPLCLDHRWRPIALLTASSVKWVLHSSLASARLRPPLSVSHLRCWSQSSPVSSLSANGVTPRTARSTAHHLSPTAACGQPLRRSCSFLGDKHVQRRRRSSCGLMRSRSETLPPSAGEALGRAGFVRPILMLHWRFHSPARP